MKIEVTPEMIAAGLATFEADYGVISDQGVVEAVYIAMREVALRRINTDIIDIKDDRFEISDTHFYRCP